MMYDDCLSFDCFSPSQECMGVTLPAQVINNRFPLENRVITCKRSDSPDLVAACCKDAFLKLKFPIMSQNGCICVNMIQYSRVLKMRLKGWKTRKLKHSPKQNAKHFIAKIRARNANGKFAAGCVKH